MDEEMESPPENSSCEVHSTHILDLNKKRKLQFEFSNSGLPWPKHKFRDRSSNSGQEYSIAETTKSKMFLKVVTNCGIDGGLDEAENSENDRNSYIGGYDNTMALDVKGKTEELTVKPSRQDQPSTTSNNSSNSSNSVSNSPLYSLDSIPNKEALEDQYSGFGSHCDHIISEFEKKGVDQEGAAVDDLMLYSNDVALNAFILSSGRWSVGQDARLGSRKPTIDQEFEKYFSMLML